MAGCWKYIVWILIVLLFRCIAQAAADEPMRLQRIDAAITLDGFSDEPAWQRIEPLPLTMYEPTTGGKPSERSEIRIGYDNNYLYASARFYDSDPNGVRANSLYRDRWIGDDTFELVLDTFNDNENALHFSTTPNGIRFDEAVFNDASGSDPFNINWNTVWDVAAKETKEGWFAEMRIPFSSLRFQPVNGQVIMGLTAFRFIVRKNETDIFPARRPELERAVMRPSVARDVLLEGINAKRPLYVSPYVLAGLGQSSVVGPLGRSYQMQNDSTDEAGGDAKLSLNSDLTMDLTANTDFAQVESDDLQINLNRFSLFFPEKRPFFQERASLFDFPTGRSGQLFYSRRIGLDEAGNPVRIFGGARLSGRVSQWDVGFLDMQTGSSDATPSENFGVLRMRRSLLNDASYAGGMMTSRIGADGTRSISYGLDSTLRFWGKDTLSVGLAQTLDQVASTRDSAFGSGMIRTQWERPARTGWGYRAGATYSGPDFDPDIGFLERKDFSLLDLRLAYGIEGKGNARYRVQNFSVNQFAYFRNSDHSLESSDFWTTWEVNLKSGHYLNLSPNMVYENVRTPFSLSPTVQIPAGTYTNPTLETDYNTPYGHSVGMEISNFVGGFFDGQRYGVRVWPRWYASRFLELSGDFWYSHAVFPDRHQTFDATLLRLRANVAFNTRYSVSSFLQYSSVDAAAGVNIRFRYNPREGNDIYVVYNQGFDTDNPNLFPLPPRNSGRTLLVKYVHMFDFSG